MRENKPNCLENQFGFVFLLQGHKSGVFVKKILLDFIRLFAVSENEVKMGFLWKWCKNYKKNFFFVIYYHTSMCDQNFRLCTSF